MDLAAVPWATTIRPHFPCASGTEFTEFPWKKVDNEEAPKTWMLPEGLRRQRVGPLNTHFFSLQQECSECQGRHKIKRHILNSSELRTHHTIEFEK